MSASLAVCVACGSEGGETVAFTAAFFRYGPERIGILLVLGSPDAKRRHGAQLDGLLQSLRPALEAP